MEIEKLFVSLFLDAAKYNQGLEDAQKEGNSWASRMRQSIGGGIQKAAKIATGALLGVGLTIGGVVAAGTNQFIGFENSMNEVFTLLPGISQDAMDDMSGQVLQFSRDFAVLPEQVVPALYQSLSAGVPPDNVFSFLETAQKAAVGGVTDLETAVDGISSVVNAYGSDVLSAANASDVMFTAVRLGKTDFEQLSSSLFNVIPTAASLNIQFGEVAAGLATLTAQGTPTSVATTQLRQLFVEASKSGSQLDQTIRGLTGQGISGLISEGRTVTSVLQDVRDSVGEEEFRNMFGSVEALNAALGTTGPNVELMTSNIDAMNASAGATDAAYGTMNKGIQRSIDAFRAFANTALIQVGDALSPLVDKALELGEQVLPIISNILEGTIVPAITDFAHWIDLASQAVAAGGFDALFTVFEDGSTRLDRLLEVFGLSEEAANAMAIKFIELKNSVMTFIEPIADWVTQNVQLKDVLTALGIAIASIVIPAILSVVASVAPIIIGFGLLIGAVTLVRTAWENDWNGIQEKTAVAWDWIKNIFEQLRGWVVETLIPTVQNLWLQWTTVWWPAISQALSDAWNNVIQPALQALWAFTIDVLIPTIQDLWTQWTTIWWPAISQALDDAWNNVIKPALDALWTFVTETLIPTIQDLWTKWTTIWWPEISTALENAWTIISTIWTELGRWINDNIVPWLEFLHDKWVDEIFPAIQKVVEDLQPVWERVMSAIQSAIEPVKSAIDGIKSAAESFWNWISSHTFEFDFHLPDLPDWAIPGSPLPIHTAWANFAKEMNQMNIAPKVNLAGVTAVAGAGVVNSSDSSSTTYAYNNYGPAPTDPESWFKHKQRVKAVR